MTGDAAQLRQRSRQSKMMPPSLPLRLVKPLVPAVLIQKVIVLWALLSTEYPGKVIWLLDWLAKRVTPDGVLIPRQKRNCSRRRSPHGRQTGLRPVWNWR